MEHGLIEAAEALAEALAEENAALTALDLARAAGMLARKSAAAAAFAAAVERARHAGGLLADQQRSAALAGTRLRELGAENRRLLEHGLHLQGRVLAAIAKALPKATGGPPRYGASGSLTQARRVQPITLSARA